MLRGATRPTRPHGASIWQSFPATKQRRATRPGMLNPFWSFESRLRGAARPDGHTVLAFGNRFLQRGKGARRAPDC